MQTQSRRRHGTRSERQTDEKADTMKLYPEELALSREYARGLVFEGLSDDQLNRFRQHGERLHRWFKGHPYLHNAIGVPVFLFLFGVDYWALLVLPRWFLPVLPDGQSHPIGMILLAGAIAGSIHSYLMYSMAIYSVHEAFTHEVLFQKIGPISRAAHAIASQLCRLTAAEPHFYAEHHLTHHREFGSEHDGELLNFVRPRRYWMSWLPFAALYSDFVSHRPTFYNRSRVITLVLTLLFNGVYSYFMYQAFGAWFVVLVMVVFYPHFGHYLDRTRQFTEHNLMPLENKNGARSFGLGFWGMLLGGGPWGTPCHLEHHLIPFLPWYQQLMLHRHFRALLTPRQREQFLVQPVIGWPKLWWRLVRDHNAIESRLRGGGFPTPGH
jgi:fatty acid desaturase